MGKEYKIRKECIGSKLYHKVLNKHFTIDYGNEELYARLGLDVFEIPSKPKLNKDAKKTRKKRNKQSSGDGNGTNHDYES